LIILLQRAAWTRYFYWMSLPDCRKCP